MSALGHKRKSSVGLGMSGVGGGAEVDFGRLEVCFWPIADIGSSSLGRIVGLRLVNRCKSDP